VVIPVSSNKKRFRIRIGIRALTPFHLGIKAYDATRYNTHYFRRKVTFLTEDFSKGTTYREITIPMPVSPDTLSVELIDKFSKDDTSFRIEKFKIEDMPASRVWADEHMHDFIRFAEDFCQKAGYVKTGFYHSLDYQFLIHYLPKITGSMGQVMITPARTQQVTGRHQVAQELFKQFSIPVRLFIMLHERQHFTLPTRKEKPADMAALKLYLDLGYPTIEAVYAATKVFLMHPGTTGPEQVIRTKDIIDFIDRYKATHTAVN
tara:strand:- start:37444 stop:38229 length:786 start_codon:yes stop_codon:yes gene_type:complete